jgi:hypothetical protein
MIASFTTKVRDNIQNMHYMWGISISEILCEINPKNREISLLILKIISSKSACKPYCIGLAKTNPMM